jgi:hypothetical protein
MQYYPTVEIHEMLREEETNMIEEMRSRLAELSEQLNRVRRIDTMLHTLQGEREELIQREAAMKSILQKEEADVERLERITLTSIFYSILGSREEQRKQEDQEAYAARLKYEAAVRQQRNCEERMEALKKEKASLSKCQPQYDNVFQDLQKLLRSDPSYADRLCTLEEQHGEILGQLKELDEAILAGKAVQHQIHSIEDSLDSAEGWGTWDILGGGLISTMAKHSHLDDAQNSIEHLQTLLSRFRAELADVSLCADLGMINIDGFLRFADYFFDGLIADWMVLSRIHSSQERIQELKGQTGGVLQLLSDRKSALEKKKRLLKDEISRLVTADPII